MTNACECATCKAACSRKPGWFKPGEAEKAAEYLELSIQDFFGKYLGVDWWEGGDEGLQETFVLAPAVRDMEPGAEYPGDPYGQCVFFEDGLCKIHPVKPFECKELLHDGRYVSLERHEAIAMEWRVHQGRIVDLLGRAPVSTEYCEDALTTWKQVVL